MQLKEEGPKLHVIPVDVKAIIISLKQEMETPWCVDKLFILFSSGIIPQSLNRVLKIIALTMTNEGFLLLHKHLKPALHFWLKTTERI